MSRISYNNSMHLLISIFFLIMAMAINYSNATQLTNYGSGLKGMFIFGSSIVDNGNNNNLIADFAKANFMPYGIDYPLGPTGRFSNGNNVADLITHNLMLPIAPPLSSLGSVADAVVHGVNLASGGSGILDDTGALLGVSSMKKQIENFEKIVVPELKKHYGRKTVKIVGEYLFLVGAGNNDYSSYYISQQYKVMDPMIFAATLITDLQSQLQKLYNLGARKFILLSVYPVGCNPILTENKTNCVEELDAAVTIYHDQLVSMVKHKYKNMPKALFSVVNSHKIIMDIITNGNQSGFMNVNGTCCDTSITGICKKQSEVCQTRDMYVYFDGLHLTEAASAILADKAYYSTHFNEVYPFNLQILSQL